MRLACLLVFVISCAGSYRPAPDHDRSGNSDDISAAAIDREKANALQKVLMTLNHHSNGDEAGQVAQTALQASAHLAVRYRLVQPPFLHNLFVQMGLRDRGLCYHWTADLMSYLNMLQLQDYELHWGVAYRGSTLREHNTVVITASGQPFENGLVLDPWRHSGKLYWVMVQNDSYPWRELPREEW